MNRYFEEFYEDYAPAIEGIPARQSLIDSYRGKLPDRLLEYWANLWFVWLGRGLVMAGQSR